MVSLLILLSQGTHFYTCGSLKSFLYYLVAAAAAKSLQSCPTLCDPIDGMGLSLGFSLVPSPWDSPGKNTGVGCHFPYLQFIYLFFWGSILFQYLGHNPISFHFGLISVSVVFMQEAMGLLCLLLSAFWWMRIRLVQAS